MGKSPFYIKRFCSWTYISGLLLHILQVRECIGRKYARTSQKKCTSGTYFLTPVFAFERSDFTRPCMCICAHRIACRRRGIQRQKQAETKATSRGIFCSCAGGLFWTHLYYLSEWLHSLSLNSYSYPYYYWSVFNNFAVGFLSSWWKGGLAFILVNMYPLVAEVSEPREHLLHIPSTITKLSPRAPGV